MSIESFIHVEGRPVIAMDTAEAIGTVKGFVLDTRGRSIEAIHIDGHGRRASILDWSLVNAFGADAVMASPGAVPSPVETEHQKAAVKGGVTMLGTRVLTVEGREVGTVADVQFDTESGALVRVVTDQGVVESARLRSLGSYALVVDADPSGS